MAEKKRMMSVGTGYSKVFSLLNTVFNILLSLLLIICAIPFFLIITLLIKIEDRGPVLYKGVRLGLNKKPFIMFKFRTLIPDAQRIIGAELLTEKIASTRHLETPLGAFLRDTRLDELPQLFNILKGDMDFLGPRPERPEIYERFCRHIRGYDKRFLVKPGLIGYSQLFTPHSAPKRLRAMIDNRFLLKKQNLLWDVFIVSLTIVVVLGRIIRYGSRFICNTLVKSKLLGRFQEHRNLERVKTHDAVVHLGPHDEAREVFDDEVELADINEEAILVYSNHPIRHNRLILKMEIILRSLHGRRNRKKEALCHGTVYKTIMVNRGQHTYAHVILYSPVSPLNVYMVHQYFLHKSII
jgi:lipopolysaccharide/colanic/teichoic acid biosynthesis glycosyltransferase